MSEFANRLLANPFVQWTVSELSTSLAQRIYFVGGLLAVLLISLRLAQKQDSFLKGLDCELKAADDFEVHKPGPAPASVAGLKKRVEAVEKKLNEFKKGLTGRLGRHGAALLVFGLMVPSFAVASFFYYYSWLFPHAAALSYAGQHSVIPQPSMGQIALVIVTQIGLGLEAASRSMEEVFTPLLAAGAAQLPTYNGSDPVISSTILFYRILIGGFVATLAYGLVQYLSVRLLQPKQLRKLRHQLSRAERANTAAKDG